MRTEVQNTKITPKWVRSSHCGPANCVELSIGPTEVIICDSKRGKIARLAFCRTSWTSFLNHCVGPVRP
jgi:hypothetical protein